jgi:hypothetical protein
MTTLTLRSTKGLPLTHQEVDDNFSNLDSDMIDSAGVNSLWDTRYATKNLIVLDDGASSSESQPTNMQVLTAVEYLVLGLGANIDSDTLYFLT